MGTSGEPERTAQRSLRAAQKPSTAIASVVGALQLDVLKERLKIEHGIPIDDEQSRFSIARWIMSDEKGAVDTFEGKNVSAMARDLDGAPVFLAPSAYGLKYEEDRYPAIRFTDIKTYQAKFGRGDGVR